MSLSLSPCLFISKTYLHLSLRSLSLGVISFPLSHLSLSDKDLSLYLSCSLFLIVLTFLYRDLSFSYLFPILSISLYISLYLSLFLSISPKLSAHRSHSLSLSLSLSLASLSLIRFYIFLSLSIYISQKPNTHAYSLYPSLSISLCASLKLSFYLSLDALWRDVVSLYRFI